eukprot:365788-Chlamydomonas_euryale.AAC.10
MQKSGAQSLEAAQQRTEPRGSTQAAAVHTNARSLEAARRPWQGHAAPCLRAPAPASAPGPPSPRGNAPPPRPACFASAAGTRAPPWKRACRRGQRQACAHGRPSPHGKRPLPPQTAHAHASPPRG